MSSAFKDLILISVRQYVSFIFLMAVANVFCNWYRTLYLLHSKYDVSFLNHEIIAVVGTLGSFSFSALLIIGFHTKFAALGLSVINILGLLILNTSFNDDYYLHFILGCCLFVIVFFGGGRIALDNFYLKTGYHQT